MFQAVQKDFRRGHNKRDPEEVHTKLRLNRSLGTLPLAHSYVEGLSAVRTKPKVFFQQLAHFSCQALTRRAVITPSTRSIAFKT